MPVKKKRIEFGDIHTCVFGITGSGKTYGTLHSLKSVKEPVIFVNTKHDTQSVPRVFVGMSPENSYIQLKRAITRGSKINYVISSDERQRDKELSNLIRFLFSNGNLPVYFVVDEVHLYGKRSVYYKLMEIATTGRSYGIRFIPMSQRPANIDNNLMTQCDRFIAFKCPLENQYLKRYGFPVDEMKDLFKKGGEYAYLEFDLDSLSGPFKV
ncbi:type IV secretory system conjugative DNA transfer family protein [Dehalobacter restrictus]|uniref:type IV secretory system conjugative DNA transfer family protein n=1 Tax=Dehalobacter restrictus TaxID=55583 RepID=UPI00338FA04A